MSAYESKVNSPGRSSSPARTDAPDLSPAEAAIVARFEAAPVPEELLREMVARSLCDSDHQHLGACPWDGLEQWARDSWLRLADAALAVFRQQPNEAVQRDGASLIATERRRQIEAEGWTPEHDAEHHRDGLAIAAACYATPARLRDIRGGYPYMWIWARRFWKPTPDDRVRELVKAGALIAAEIDRLAAVAGGSDA